MIDDKLFYEIKKDLFRDFCEIESIENTNEGIKVTACDDTLWLIYDLLEQKVQNVELHLNQDNKNFLYIRV